MLKVIAREGTAKTNRETFRPSNLRSLTFLIPAKVQLKDYFDRQTPHIQHQTDEGVKKLLSRLNDYNLTKVEKLMILNSRPTSLATLHILIEEHEDRFSLEEMNSLLEHVKECFPVSGK